MAGHRRSDRHTACTERQRSGCPSSTRMTSQHAGPPGPGAPPPPAAPARRSADPVDASRRRDRRRRPAAHLPGRRHQRLPGLAPQERAAQLQPRRRRTIVAAVRQRRRRAVLRDARARAPASRPRTCRRRSRRCARRRTPTSSRPRTSTRPGDLGGAQQSLLIALELRRDGAAVRLRADRHRAGQRGRRRRPGDRGDRRPDAGVPGLRRADPHARHPADPRRRSRTTTWSPTPPRPSGFLPGFSWLQPAFVADQLGTRLTGGGGGGGNGNTGKLAPGLHGNGLVSTEVNGVDAAAGPGRATRSRWAATSPSSSSSPTRARTRSPTSQVNVTLPGRHGQGHHRQEDGRRDRRGRVRRGRRSRCRASRRRGEVYTVNVEVKAVPGEKKTDNNKSTYNVLFE